MEVSNDESNEKIIQIHNIARDDYSSQVTLNDGAKVKLDVSLADTASADKFAIASGGVTINENKRIIPMEEDDASPAGNASPEAISEEEEGSPKNE